MVAHTALVIVAIVAMVGAGAVAAAGVFSTSSAGNINLGTLSPGQSGNATATTTVNVANTTSYKFQLEKEDRIGCTFSNFSVQVTANGQTYNLTSERNASHINLTSGKYTFTIHLSYTVRDLVQNVSETNIAFLFLHPVENETYDNESGDNELNDTSMHVLSADDNGYDNQSNADRMVLFTLTFHVNGNIGMNNEEGISDILRAQSMLPTP